MDIIGRKREIAELNTLYHSGKSEFVAVYGRRRVGKTYLIDETLEGKITFRHAGLSPVEQEQARRGKQQQPRVLKLQLKHFYMSLLRHGMHRTHCPTSWIEAFYMLSQLLESLQTEERQVVFLDELPWMDTPRSGFITAFEGFWNTWGCHRRNLMLVVCGSATSWIQNNLIDGHGGLYGRVTRLIKLHPFSLHECEEFYRSRGIRLSRYDITQCYMVLGGIPYYMNYVERGLSVAQIVDSLFFGSDARLQGEYDRLFASVFSKPDEMKRIVETLHKRHGGWTRTEIVQKTGIPNNGLLGNMLKALTESGFAECYTPFGLNKRDTLYKLTDPFCWFWLHFVKNRTRLPADFWKGNATQSIVSWRGIAFEEICWCHWREIKQALHIAGITTELSSWTQRGDADNEGAQIDLLIQRGDNVVNMCEMKFYNEPFTVSKTYHQKLLHRQNLIEAKIGRRKVVHPTLVTTEGLRENEYSHIFQSVITLDDLFAPA